MQQQPHGWELRDHLYNGAVRRLIVNADDFGLTSGVNRGIAEAHTQGMVTSATLMANGSAFQEAVQLAAASPRLSVGCHVVLIDGNSLRPDVQSLLDQDGDRQLRSRLPAFAAGALMGRIHAADVEAEAIAQIRKLQSAGIAVSHLDTHKHTHIFPIVLRGLLRAARACHIRALRNPFSPRIPLLPFLRRPELLKRYLEVQIVRTTLEGRFQKAVREAGLATPDGSFGVIATGALDQALFRRILKLIPEGTWEFVCHPGYQDSDLQRIKTRLRDSRVEELRVLTSQAAREALAECGIELISYRDLT